MPRAFVATRRPSAAGGRVRAALALPVALFGASACRTATVAEKPFVYEPTRVATAVSYRPGSAAASGGAAAQQDAAPANPTPEDLSYEISGLSLGDRAVTGTAVAGSAVAHKLLPDESAGEAVSCPASQGLGKAMGDWGPELAVWMAVSDHYWKREDDGTVRGQDKRLNAQALGSASRRVIDTRKKFQPAGGLSCELSFSVLQLSESEDATDLQRTIRQVQEWKATDTQDQRLRDLGLLSPTGALEWSMTPEGNRWRLHVQFAAEFEGFTSAERLQRNLNCTAEKPIYASDFGVDKLVSVWRAESREWLACYTQ